jgi:hypothetical protein
MSVAKKIIKMNLSEASIDDAIKQVRTYRNSLETQQNKLLRLLSEIGLREASVRFTSAMYDGINDSSVNLKITKNGCVIEAKGKAVAFIEFGAGVYHNSGEPYPEPRPDGIVGIGEYGKGHGKRKAWGYKDASGELVVTHGNPAAMPMWYASEEMRSKLQKIAREVFG